MSYDPHVVNAILRIGGRRNESRRYILEALATGIVESGLRNLGGGDADSAGWRQERASIYPNPTNLSASINRFFDELHQMDKGQAPGWLSADVQRPAEQYRGRYADVWKEAQKVLAGKGGYVGGTSGGPVSPGGSTPQANDQPNIFQALAKFNQNTKDQSNPVNQTLQQGWDLLAQLASQKGNPLDTGATAMLSGGSGGGNIKGLHEAFYNPVGDWDEGNPIGAVSGHDTHAHFGGQPSTIASIVRRAERNGLTVRDYAPVDHVDRVHAPNSWHYRYGGRGGADISGDPDKLAAFFRRIARRAGLR